MSQESLDRPLFDKGQNITIDNYKEILPQRGLSLVTNINDLKQVPTANSILNDISGWIDDVNKEQEILGKPETMIPRSSKKIAHYLEGGQAVIVLEQNVSGILVPCGFCALPYDLKEEAPGTVLELGTLIRSPYTKQRNIGQIATLATLGLPIAQNAQTIVAYANMNSLAVFLRMGARIVPHNELREVFPYLPEYSGDTIVDLTSIKTASTR